MAVLLCSCYSPYFIVSAFSIIVKFELRFSTIFLPVLSSSPHLSRADRGQIRLRSFDKKQKPNVLFSSRCISAKKRKNRFYFNADLPLLRSFQNRLPLFLVHVAKKGYSSIFFFVVFHKFVDFA